MYDKPEGNTYRLASNYSTAIFLYHVLPHVTTIRSTPMATLMCVDPYSESSVNPLLCDAAEPEMNPGGSNSRLQLGLSRPPPTDPICGDAMRALNVQALDGTIVVNVM